MNYSVSTKSEDKSQSVLWSVLFTLVVIPSYEFILGWLCQEKKTNKTLSDLGV